MKIAVTEAWRPLRRQRDPTWTQVHTFARHGSDLTLGWGKLLTLFSYFDRNLILKWLLFCLLGGKKHLWGCLFSTDAPTPSFTHFFPCHPFCLCPDTFCPCHSSSRVKNSGVGFDYLITMVTRMTLMPTCAWQDSANLYFRRKGLCFPAHNSQPPLCRSCWCCTMKLSVKHQGFRENQRVKIGTDRLSCMET